MINNVLLSVLHLTSIIDWITCSRVDFIGLNEKKFAFVQKDKLIMSLRSVTIEFINAVIIWQFNYAYLLYHNSTKFLCVAWFNLINQYIFCPVINSIPYSTTSRVHLCSTNYVRYHLEYLVILVITTDCVLFFGKCYFVLKPACPIILSFLSADLGKWK